MRLIVITPALLILTSLGSTFAQQPILATKSPTTQVGDQAADFELSAVHGALSGNVRLSELTKDSKVVVVVLRGFPGYQCGICSRQVGELVANASKFANKGAKVLLIYPGADDGLQQRSQEFLKGSKLPSPFSLLIDPGYQFTNLYGLRWDAPNETAYPSTFVIGQDNKILYSEISRGHGGRTKPSNILKTL